MNAAKTPEIVLSIQSPGNRNAKPKRLKQSQPLRIEDPEIAWFSTSKCCEGRLWFLGNKALEYDMLAQVAKYQAKYQVIIYSFVIMGNHVHMVAQFPNRNRAKFKRDLNARFAELVKKHRNQHPEGAVFGRRYSAEALPAAPDTEARFFYCALQAVNSGLSEHIEDYPAYNSFKDAIEGREGEFKIVRWAEYHSRKRHNSKLKKEDFTDTYRLRYTRLPSYEKLSQEEYALLMKKKLEEKRLKIVAAFKQKKHKYPSAKSLRKVTPGSKPKKTKKSTRHSSRPLVLCVCPIRRQEYLERYFSIYIKYKAASQRYLGGDRNATFPEGTYKPPGPLVLN